MFYKNWTIFNLCQKKNYIILNFNYPMVNTFLVIFLNQKVGSILNLIRKVYLLILPITFWTTKKIIIIIIQQKSKRIKINLNFIFNNFPMHRTGLRLVILDNNATEYTFSCCDTCIKLTWQDRLDIKMVKWVGTRNANTLFCLSPICFFLTTMLGWGLSSVF